jgi:hypothetical protein
LHDIRRIDTRSQPAIQPPCDHFAEPAAVPGKQPIAGVAVAVAGLPQKIIGVWFVSGHASPSKANPARTVRKVTDENVIFRKWRITGK